MGRRGGRSHRKHHHHHHHHHHHSRGKSAPNAGATFETSMDLLHNNMLPPTLVNGVYSFIGSEMSFRAKLQQPLISSLQTQNIYQHQGMESTRQNGNIQFQQMNPFMQDVSPMDNPLMQQMNSPMRLMNQPIQSDNVPIQQISISIIGNKTKSVDNCCYCLTMLFGSVFVFPLCFMCCMWWKKIVYPKYELSSQAYRDIGAFIQQNPTANNLTLTVVDNAFNAQKARILYEALNRSRITALTLVNEALDCNGEFNQVDDFRNNVLPIKSLNITSSITWGQMVL